MLIIHLEQCFSPMSHGQWPEPEFFKEMRRKLLKTSTRKWTKPRERRFKQRSSSTVGWVSNCLHLTWLLSIGFISPDCFFLLFLAGEHWLVWPWLVPRSSKRNVSVYIDWMQEQKVGKHFIWSANAMVCQCPTSYTSSLKLNFETEINQQLN